MGYRSDVRIMTSKKGFDKLKKFTNNYLKEKNCINLLDKCEILKENNFFKYFGWNSIKWYKDFGYESIDAIEKGLNYLADNDYSYRFARIGEDYDDYEEKSYDSKNQEEIDLEYPCMNREFDDKYISQIVDIQKNLDL